MDVVVYDKIGKESDRLENLLLATFPQKTITDAPIASFADGADGIPIKSLSVAIEPVQDLHGQDAPYPAGGGKNLLDPAKRTTYGSGLGQRWYATDGITLKANQPYTMSVNSSESIFAYFIDKATNTTLLSGKMPQTYTPTEDVVVYLQAYGSIDISSIDTFQLELGSTATDYAPYSNICPISGHTECNVTRCGKNLLPRLDSSSIVSGITASPNADGSIDFSGTATASGSAVFSRFSLPAGTYKFSSIGSSLSVTGTAGIVISNVDTSTILVWLDLSNNIDREFTIAKKSNLQFYAVYQNGASISGKARFMIRFSSDSDATFAPYFGTTYPITFPSGTGTVYGGTLDATNRVLTVDRKSVEIQTLDWYYDNSNALFTVDIPDIKSYSYTSNITKTICSSYKYKGSNKGWASMVFGDFGIANKNFRIKDTRYNTASAFKTALTGETILYELAEPISIPLSVPQITTLLGQNSLFADCNGDVSVTYRADTALYIAKKIAEALA